MDASESGNEPGCQTSSQWKRNRSTQGSKSFRVIRGEVEDECVEEECAENSGCVEGDQRWTKVPAFIQGGG